MSHRGPSASLRLSSPCHRQSAQNCTFLLQPSLILTFAKSLGASALPMNVNLTFAGWILFVYRFIDLSPLRRHPYIVGGRPIIYILSHLADHFCFIELLKDSEPGLAIFQFPPVFTVVLKVKMFPRLFCSVCAPSSAIPLQIHDGGFSPSSSCLQFCELCARSWDSPEDFDG